MRFKVTQRILAGSPDLVWVVWDTQEHKIVSRGTYVSCANACRELNQAMPPTRLSQSQIDGEAEHRRGFLFHLSQIKQMVFPSTQQLVTETVRKGER
jgi:hypothetical protein